MPSNEEMKQLVIAAVSAKISPGGDINACWTYDLGPDGHIFVDCRNMPHRILRENGDAPCRITISLEDLWRVMTGQLDSQTAFTQGKVRLTGDMELILRIDTLMGTYRAAQGA